MAKKKKIKWIEKAETKEKDAPAKAPEKMGRRRRLYDRSMKD